MEVNGEDTANFTRKWLRVVLGIGGVLVAWSFFRWSIIDFLPIIIFFQFLIEAGLWGLFIVTTIFSAVYYAVKARKAGWEAGKYTAIVLIFAIIVVTFPYNDVVLKADFRFNLAERERVVAMVKAGDPALQPAPVREFKEFSLQTFALPPEYSHLSKGGGKIVVQRTGIGYKIFFYTFRGVLDNFSGFVYVSDDNGLGKEDFRGDFKEVEKMRDNWFFGASL
jgi:hypothetical protein